MVRRLREEGFALDALCESLLISRSAYYAWEGGEKNSRQREDEQWMPLVRAIFLEHKRRYGARRIAKELSARGVPCGVKRVGRLMRAMELVAIQPRSFQPKTTNSRHTLGYNENLLIDASPPTELNQVWVGDITYIPLRAGGFLYLAMLMDLCSRRIVGWSLRDHMEESLVLSALRMAIAGRQPAKGLVHHTDRGGQYAGKEYRQVLSRARMAQSMSARRHLLRQTPSWSRALGRSKRRVADDGLRKCRNRPQGNQRLHPILQPEPSPFVPGVSDSLAIRGDASTSLKET